MYAARPIFWVREVAYKRDCALVLEFMRLKWSGGWGGAAHLLQRRRHSSVARLATMEITDKTGWWRWAAGRGCKARDAPVL